MGEIAVIAVAALVAGIVHGVTGFGAGIVLMLVLPFFFPIPQSAGISSAICLAVCASLAVRYHEGVSLRKALLPCVPFIAVASVAISLSTTLDQAVLKRVFGVFLLVLAAYYLFFSKSGKPARIGTAVGLVFIAVSAACDGLFGIGGPLMVIYFLSRTADFREYLGTIQAFFLVNALYNTIFRVGWGILQPSHLIYIGIGMAAVLVGVAIASRIVNRVNPDVLRKLTYVMIAVCGVVNLG